MAAALSSLTQYGNSFQTKVLSCLLTDKAFLQNMSDSVTDEYFENQGQKWIINEILKYYDKYHTTPSLEVLKVELKKLNNEVLQLSIKEQLKEAYKASEEDLRYVEEEFSNFCNIGHEYNKDTESRYREEHRIAIPTPWKEFNELFQGGIGNGDFGLIFGNPGGGKSWCLVALGGMAVQLGYNVLHYTLELGEDYVGRRYDSYFTDIPVQEISKYKADVEKALEGLEGQLIIKEYATGRASISTIESHIKKCIDLGFKPDLILIDYVDLLRSKRVSRERKDEIDDVYVSTKGLARELKLPIWSVSQVNRSGAKDDIIEGDKAAGSYEKIMITDIAISLSRKKEDKINNTGRFHIMKNRYGGDGMTYNAKIDTSTGHFKLLGDFEENNAFTTSDSFDSYNKTLLKNKFFELNKNN